ncbi:MAG: hypothetical protein IKC32_00700 [Clostridia bacterium]|nr:hypothetical protein [Clostridia bacterium]
MENNGNSAAVSGVGGKLKALLSNKKVLIGAIAAVLVVAIVISAIAITLSLLGAKPDAFVIMTEELDGLFNPFFSTTAADGTIVSMTQIGMLTTGYENGEVTIEFGDDQAVVTKDFEQTFDGTKGEKGQTTYTFVIKNGIKYSDGVPLTIGDVLFNLYVYLDPVYTGSATMYSTDILGLAEYRSQTHGADSDIDETISGAAQVHATNRMNELINLFMQAGKTQTAGTYSATYDQMKAAILAHGLSAGYKQAISNNPDEVTVQNLLADYELALKYFKEELGDDYVSAQEAYTEIPYKNHKEFKDPIFAFMCYEGLVEIKYKKDPVTNKDIKTEIETLTPMYNTSIKTMEEAIDYVYNRKISTELHQILMYWATAQKLQNEYLAKAKAVVLHASITDGELAIPSIEGIKSLGHTAGAPTTVTVNGTTYTVAKEHNEDGTPKNAGEYDILQITIDGVDPKAVWNFAFAVAPQHYYAEGYDVDIANNKFGVEFGSYEFMTDVIQSVRNIKVPVGAGAYKATNAKNEDNPQGTAFFQDNVVYFKANTYFETVGEGIENAKIEKVRYKVTSASNALNALESGEVHYVTPQLTDDNINKINSMKNKGIESTYTDQLGYGYIGINAGKVKDINLRRAIMAAMDTSRALSYYRTGTAETIYWPMSTVSWAYPKDAQGKNDRDNLHDYPAKQFNDETAMEQIRNYMTAAGVAEGDSELSIKFTIAGANLTDHPTYNTFIHAAELLNKCGWDIEVVADTQALTKLSTGSLAVWAAAWGSTIDPDLYQVYHKNSTATSVLAWGYREILQNTTSEEYGILSDLSDVIDQARETDDIETRKGLYRQALGYILDLAVELPVYQRSVLYAYNTNVIDETTFPEVINPYSSPLDKIWEIEFAK